MQEDFFKIETHPNRDIVTYHVRCALLMREKGKSSLFAKKTLLPKTEEILQVLRELKGIEDAYSHNKYSLSVEKGQAFTWAELNPKVMEIVYSLKEDRASVNRKEFLHDQREDMCLNGERRDAPCICGLHEEYRMMMKLTRTYIYTKDEELI